MGEKNGIETQFLEQVPAERSASRSGTGSPLFTHTLACAGRAEKVRSSGVWALTFGRDSPTSAPKEPEPIICECALEESCCVSKLKPFSYRLRACNSSVEATVRLVHVCGKNRRPEQNLTNWSRWLSSCFPIRHVRGNVDKQQRDSSVFGGRGDARTGISSKRHTFFWGWRENQRPGWWRRRRREGFPTCLRNVQNCEKD